MYERSDVRDILKLQFYDKMFSVDYIDKNVFHLRRRKISFRFVAEIFIPFYRLLLVSFYTAYSNK